MVGILTFLQRSASLIALLKGIEKEDKDTLFEEPPIWSTGGLWWPNSINEGESQYLYNVPYFRPLLAQATQWGLSAIEYSSYYQGPSYGSGQWRNSFSGAS